MSFPERMLRRSVSKSRARFRARSENESHRHTDDTSVFPRKTRAPSLPEAAGSTAFWDRTQLILDAVRRLRTAMSRRGKAGRKTKRGRNGAKSKAAAGRRGLTVKEKAHFVFKR